MQCYINCVFAILFIIFILLVSIILVIVIVTQVILYSGEPLSHKGLSIEIAYLNTRAKSYSILF